jgi:biotin transport system substrate-specific component
MTLVATSTPTPVLTDLLPGARVRDVACVLGATGAIAMLSQVVVPLPFTPVPLSLSTLAVLLTGLALGPARAFASTALYLVLGTLGLPIFADHGAGWAFASYGYVLGYVAAAVLAGRAARRGADRSSLQMVGVAAAATVAVYACGVPWLMAFLQIGLAEALAIGVAPFLVGDAIKAAAAALLLPTAWRVLGTGRHGARG